MPLALNNYALQQVKFKCLLYVFMYLSLVEFPLDFEFGAFLNKLWMALANLLTQNNYGDNFDSEKSTNIFYLINQRDFHTLLFQA